MTNLIYQLFKKFAEIEHVAVGIQRITDYLKTDVYIPHDTNGLWYKIQATDGPGGVITAKMDQVGYSNPEGNIVQLGTTLVGTSVVNIASLRAVTGLVQYGSIAVLSHTTVGDGGGGLFYYDENSGLADNNATIIQPNSIVGFGRWLKYV